MTEKRFMVDDAGTLIDMQTGNTYDYVSDVCPLLNALNDENEQLKHDATVLIQANQDYRKENEQLKQRNYRQAKRLGELYELMAKKDWESLTEIIDDFCSCEEQLKREWGTYGDVE